MAKALRGFEGKLIHSAKISCKFDVEQVFKNLSNRFPPQNESSAFILVVGVSREFLIAVKIRFQFDGMVQRRFCFGDMMSFG